MFARIKDVCKNHRCLQESSMFARIMDVCKNHRSLQESSMFARIMDVCKNHGCFRRCINSTHSQDAGLCVLRHAWPPPTGPLGVEQTHVGLGSNLELASFWVELFVRLASAVSFGGHRHIFQWQVDLT